MSDELLDAVSVATQPGALIMLSEVGRKLLHGCRCQDAGVGLTRCSRLLACVWCHMASSVETASASLGSRFLQSSAQPSSARYTS